MKCTQNNSAYDLPTYWLRNQWHYSEVILGTVVSQITSISIVYSTICSGTDQRKHQSSASLAFVRRIHWWPLNSPHKGPVSWKMFPFDDIIIDLSHPKWWSFPSLLHCHWMMILRSIIHRSQSSLKMRQSTWWISYISISKSKWLNA